jgi:DNA-binding MarR family transcriptional regulator
MLDATGTEPGRSRALNRVASEPETPESLGPVLDLMRLFWGLDHTIQLASRSLESRIGLTEPQRAVVWLVAETPGITIGEIAERQHWHSATVTGIVQRLEARGVLVRKADRQDRRRKLVSLTAKGKRLAATKTVTLDQLVGRALASLPASTVASAELVIGAVMAELAARSTPRAQASAEPA